MMHGKKNIKFSDLFIDTGTVHILGEIDPVPIFTISRRFCFSTQ
jgi:hypothetical protein